MWKPIAAVVLGMMVSGCSGGGGGSAQNSDGGVDSGGGGSGACTATFSGALTGTFDCGKVIGAWASSNNTSSVPFTTSGQPSLTAGVGFSNEPQPKTYQNTDVDAQTGISISSGTKVWLASAGSGSNAGSYTLVLTDIGTVVTSSNGKGYQGMHGTLDASLDPVTASGAAGTVTLHITF